MFELYQNLLHKKAEDYLQLLELVINARREGQLKQCALMRDRGSKADYVQTYTYDFVQVMDIVNGNVEEGKWFSSMYLSWVLHETDSTFNSMCVSFDVFCNLVENNLYRRVIETNRYECYGFCMSSLILLDKMFLLKFNGEKNHVLLKLAIEGIVSYLYYHKDENPLWDAEMYSSYARLFDRFKDDMPFILMENALGSYAPYSYCYGMFEAFKCCPIETGYKLEYHKNALMMQQNQTVVGVNGDSMDANLLDAVDFGKEQFLGFTTKMLQYDLTNDLELFGFRKFVEKLNAAYGKRIIQENGFEHIKCLERFFQIEPYDKFGFKKSPYKRSAIDYKVLLDEIKVDEKSCSFSDNYDGERTLSTGVINIYPHFHQHYDYNKIENSCILYMHIIVRADNSMKAISVVGQELHELYLDVSRTGLFFNVPCIVGTWDPKYIGSTQQLFLLVGTNYDASNGFNDN